MSRYHIDPETGEILMDVRREQLRDCTLHYKLGEVPVEYESLDLTPMAVPLDGEVPLTFKEQLMRFGYMQPNPSLYNDYEDEDDEALDAPHSPYYVDEEGLNDLERAERELALQREKEKELIELGRKAKEAEATPPAVEEVLDE